MYALLDDSIQSFGKFHHEVCNFLMARQARLEIKYEKLLQVLVCLRDEEDNFHQAKRFLEVVTNLYDDFEKLQDYSRLNKEAIQRLFAKVERLIVRACFIRSKNLSGQNHKLPFIHNA